jgi:uncharacterized protein YjbI with pentapeptide repeats
MLALLEVTTMKQEDIMANQDHLATLKEGILTWNRWREQHSEITPDLSDALLSGVDLHHADFHATDLRDAILWGSTLTQANLRGAKLCDAEFNGAILYAADLSEADLTGTKLRGANLYGAILRRPISLMLI